MNPPFFSVITDSFALNVLTTLANLSPTCATTPSPNVSCLNAETTSPESVIQYLEGAPFLLLAF